MSVEFRQRSANDIIRALKRRKWLILLPIITMTAAIGYVVYKLPSVYESKTVLAVNPPKIADIVVQSLTDADVSQRIETMNATVLSRSSLEPMVAKYELFKLERNANLPMEIIIDRMRRNINVKMIKTDRDKLASFEITYRDRTPKSAREVTSELASKYVSQQVKQSTETAKETQDFIDKALEEKKAVLDTLEKERLLIMTQNIDTLPENDRGLIAQLEGLRKKEETISKEKDGLLREKSRLQDNIRSLNTQMRLIEDYGEEDAKTAAKQASQVEDTIPYGQLIQKRAELNAKLENLKISFKDKHPEVIKAKNDIEKVNDEIEKLRKSTQKRVNDATRSSTTKAQRQKQILEMEKQKAESQIKLAEQEVRQKDQELAQNSALITNLEGKINTIPSVKVALESIDNRYQSAKSNYEDLLKKKNSSQLQVNRESNAQGETIRVVDPANLPTSPVAPKREFLTALGGGLGLAIGLFLAAMFEIPRLFKIQNIEDVKHYTGLPLLASVPPLLTQSETAWRKRTHWLKILAGIAVAIGMIPILIMAIQASRVFERVVS
jgi:polysaccharide chain length determinant protein (PEP-CTERM system associated)